MIILQNAHTTVNTHTDTHTHTETDTETDRPTDRQAQLSVHTHQCLYIFRKWNNYLYFVGAKEQKQTRKQKNTKIRIKIKINKKKRNQRNKQNKKRMINKLIVTVTNWYGFSF